MESPSQGRHAHDGNDGIIDNWTMSPPRETSDPLQLPRIHHKLMNALREGSRGHFSPFSDNGISPLQLFNQRRVLQNSQPNAALLLSQNRRISLSLSKERPLLSKSITWHSCFRIIPLQCPRCSFSVSMSLHFFFSRVGRPILHVNNLPDRELHCHF
jgi:hypothetical protein